MGYFDDRDKDKRRNRRRRDPFDFFGFDDEFERMFKEMERMMEKMFRNRGDIKPGKSFVHGFNFHLGPDGKPHIEEFGNRSKRSSDGETSISDEREPLTDVMEDKKNISVTVEIPGVEKEDIDLNVTKDKLVIDVNASQRKYHKKVDLPSSVKPKTTEATYKNGVLDVSIEKEKKSSNNGYHVDIK
ncbi:MAG: archaeal heat shock protein Hsp20 [Candidatus Thermoplasmatota archaeon]